MPDSPAHRRFSSTDLESTVKDGGPAAMLRAMRTDRFDYPLPPERIAQEPLAERDAARMLHLLRADRRWTDRAVRDLPEVLRPGDLLVLNDTRVIPARLRATRDASGGQMEIFLLPPECKGARSADAAAPPSPPLPAFAPLPSSQQRLGGTSASPSPRQEEEQETLRRVLTRSGGKLRVGETFTLADGLRARLVERRGEAGDVVAFRLPPDRFPDYLTRHGEVPLPPYIKRPPGPSSERDQASYQTVFAREPGAVAAPTAGLHFTPALFRRLDDRGVERVTVTLHVGPGTFKPVKVDTVEKHRVDPEPFSIGAESAAAVTRAKAEGRRVVAVGTTVLRVLESRWNAEARRLEAGAGMADLYVYPPRRFQAVDALLTNFHLPKSSLLMLVAAFASPGSEAGIEWVKAAYAHAVASGYRFYSYGDACFFE